MRNFLYLYGIFGLVAYFPLVFALIGLDKLLHLSLAIAKLVAYLVVSLPILIGLFYFIYSVRAYKTNGIPEGFKGWRYALVGIGLTALTIGAIPIIFMLLNPMPGGASGVPLGIGLIVSFIFTLPAMAGIKK